MILLVHILFGAAIASLLIQHPFWAIIFSFFSHYLLDLIPHVEYPYDDKVQKHEWKKMILNSVKVLTDLCIGIALIFLFSRQPSNSLIYICAFIAILPDIISMSTLNLKQKIFVKHNYFHYEKVHFLQHKKISNFWRISTQVLAATIFLLILWR